MELRGWGGLGGAVTRSLRGYGTPREGGTSPVHVPLNVAMVASSGGSVCSPGGAGPSQRGLRVGRPSLWPPPATASPSACPGRGKGSPLRLPHLLPSWVLFPLCFCSAPSSRRPAS